MDCVSSNQAQPLLKGKPDMGVLDAHPSGVPSAASHLQMMGLMAMPASLQADYPRCLQQRPASPSAAEVSCR